MVSAVLFITFFVLLVLNVPISICLGLSSAAAILYSGTSLTIVATNIYSGISKFLLLAIPFFVLSGNIMAKAGISTRLIRFVNTCVGHRKGGIANVCIIVACFFGAISGSGPATVAALGAVLIPAMVESRIEMEYEHSTMEEWNVPCPSCGELQPLEWSNLIYKVDADGEIESTTYVCAKCGVVHTEVEWKEHFNEGRYVAKYPNRKVRGFHFNSLASTFFGWDKIVKGFIEADQALKKGNIELMKSWVNTELGQTWEEQGEKASKDDLLKRRERYRCEVPDEVIAITAGIDTQDDRFEVEVVGWGVEHESYGIIYKRIYGDLKQSEVWKNLDDFLKQTFKKADGTAMRISCACMDSGGHFTNKVYRFCKARTARKIFAIKGGNEGTARPYISKPTKNNREQAYLFTLGVDTGKSLLLQRLQIEEEGPGYCHFPKDENEYIRGYDEDYFKGLTAEKQVLKYKKGRPYFVWELTGETKRNEPLDCRNYAQAAIEITGLTLKEPPKKKTEVQVTRKQTRRRGNRSGGIA